MPGDDCWVELSRLGDCLGAGLLMTSRFALTACHCLGGVPGDEDELDVRFAGGEMVRGRILDRLADADLALIYIPGSPVNTVPVASQARVGDLWHSPYRPSSAHVYLSGKVDFFPVVYQCAGGVSVEAMQLNCAQPLKDFRGYSGSPVARKNPDGTCNILGLLVEQYPEQTPAGTRSEQRFTTVLIATAISEAFERFSFLSPRMMIDYLYAKDDQVTPVPGSASVSSAVPAAGSGLPSGLASERLAHDELRIQASIRIDSAKIMALHELAANSVMDPLEVSLMVTEIARKIARYKLPED